MATPEFPRIGDLSFLDNGKDIEADLDVETDLDVDDAAAIFEDAVAWLREHYEEYWKERDLVCSVQRHLKRLLADRKVPYQVLHEYPMLLGYKKVLCDLVIRDSSKTVLVAAEFKYEPAHRRPEFLAMPGKIPVVFWDKQGVGEDISKAATYKLQGSAQAAFSIFIDEGGHFRHRTPHPGSSWVDWPGIGPEGSSVSVLWAHFQ